jgi:hypothetical protein
MILIAGILGLLYGILRKDGRPASILKKHFRVWPLLFLSLGLAWLLSAVNFQQKPANPEIDQVLRISLVILQYGLLAVFLIYNRKKPGMIGLLTGSLLNGLVIALNGGCMPIGQAIQRFGETAVNRISSDPGYFLAKGSEPLLFLGDVIPFWTFAWYMISIGDIINAISFFFLAAYMPRRLIRLKARIKAHPVRQKPDESDKHLINS